MKYRLVVMLCICCLVIGMTGCGNIADKKTECNSDESKKTQSAEQEVSESEGEQVVTDGFQLTLPEGITSKMTEEGLILSDAEENYQMLVVVRDYAFNSKKETPDFFTKNVREAGYKVTREVDIVKSAEREFAYFNYLNNGDSLLQAYSKADGGKTFAALVRRDGNLSDEAILSQIADILENAEEVTE